MQTDPQLTPDATAPGGFRQVWHGHSVLTQVVAGWQWVHLSHVGAPGYLVLLKVSANADEHDAVSALEWWLRSPGREDGDVIEVS
jgi:hypothetical protein